MLTALVLVTFDPLAVNEMPEVVSEAKLTVEPVALKSPPVRVVEPAEKVPLVTVTGVLVRLVELVMLIEAPEPAVIEPPVAVREPAENEAPEPLMEMGVLVR